MLIWLTTTYYNNTKTHTTHTEIKEVSDYDD
mgnify:CR=1 FL=1